LAIVNEKGIPLGEEYTLVVAAEGYLNEKDKPEKFVVNLSTSIAIEKLAESKGSSVERSSVGEINVVNKMNEIGSNFGGEGNGGVILRDCHLGRDSLVGATMILNRMSQTDQTLSQIHSALPQYKIVKDKISLKGIKPDKIIKIVSEKFKDAEKNTLDGVKFIWKDRWVHFRKSNTEPIMRIYAEAPDQKQAEDLVNKVKEII
jgi:phosphomannomutase